MPETQELAANSRFSYVKYDEQAQRQQEDMKAAFEAVEKLVSQLKPGRAQSLVLTYLEIAYMWTGKAIRDEQIARDGSVIHAPERSKE